MDMYLSLNRKEVEDSLEDATKRAIERDGEDGETDALYEDVEFRDAESAGFNSDIELIEFSGNMFFEGKDLGYISGSIPLDFEDIIAIIEVYRKKLGKLKTVLEATKD